MLKFRLFLFSALLIGLAIVAPNASDAWTHGNSTYEGLVASRARMLQSSQAGSLTQFNFRSAHVATENLTSIKVVFSNFFCGSSIGSLGAASTVTAAVEYNGTFTPIKFGGSTSGTIADNNVLFSDYAAVNIPSGATFWVRIFWTNPSGILLNTWQNSFLGEAFEEAASGLPDKTLSGTIGVNNGGTSWQSPPYSSPPIAILGMTINPSSIQIGDSIERGLFDQEDNSNSATGFNAKVGTIARSLGNVPFLSLSKNGESAFQWIGDAGPRSQLVQKGSHLFSNLGINDIANNGKTAAQTLSSLQSVFATARPGQKIYQTTLTPDASDPGTPAAAYTTLGQQTANFNTERQNFNSSVRAGLANTRGFVDIASVLESGTTGKWVVSPSPPYTGTDSPTGLHPNVAGNALVAGANLIPALTWP